MRISLRLLMAAVALIAILLSTVAIPRWRECTSRIRFHAEKERDALLRMGEIRRGKHPQFKPGDGEKRFWLRRTEEWAEHNARERGRWERARWSFWAELPPIEGEGPE